MDLLINRSSAGFCARLALIAFVSSSPLAPVSRPGVRSVETRRDLAAASTSRRRVFTVVTTGRHPLSWPPALPADRPRGVSSRRGRASRRGRRLRCRTGAATSSLSAAAAGPVPERRLASVRRAAAAGFGLPAGVFTRIESFDPASLWASSEPLPDSPSVDRSRVDGWLRAFCRAVERTTDGVCITDRHGVIEYVNAAFASLTGYQREALIGRSTRVLRSGQHDTGFYRQLWRTVSAGDVFRRVFADRDADGNPIYLDQTITPIRDASGEVSHFVVAARDVSARVRTEAALRRLNERMEVQAKQLAQTLHDEAGQYLTAAHIALADATRDLAPADRERVEAVRAHLDRVEDELRRLAHEMHPRILDDIGLAAAVEHLAAGVERRHGILVHARARVPGTLRPVVQTAVYRVIQEALTNACRHSGASRVSVQLDFDASRLHGVVADDGAGFEAATALSGNGRTGLGLHGMRDRLEALEGHFCVTSSPGSGTEIAFSIPLEAACPFA